MILLPRLSKPYIYSLFKLYIVLRCGAGPHTDIAQAIELLPGQRRVLWAWPTPVSVAWRRVSASLSEPFPQQTSRYQSDRDCPGDRHSNGRPCLLPPSIVFAYIALLVPVD